MTKQPESPDKTPDRRRQNRGRRAEDFLTPNYRDLIDGAVQGIMVHTNFKPLYVNKAYAQLLGYDSPEEMMALPLLRPLIPPELWPQAETNYNEMVYGDLKTSFSRTRGVRKDGHEIWLSVTQRVIDWHGTPAIQVNAFDIGHQVAMEQLMLDNEQLLRAMLEILPVPVYIERRRDSRLLFVNRKTCLLFQQSAGPLLHAKAVSFFVEPEDHQKLRGLIDAVRDIREIEVQMRSAQGRSFTAEMAAIVMDYDGEPAVLVSLNDISQRKQLEAELFHQANTDALTGINNRRAFMVKADQEIRRAQRFGRALSVMMLDLDHFKQINDRLGHAAGDAVLEGTVKAALTCLREADAIGRMGGEEFAVILPETPIEGARMVAERLRQAIQEATIDAGTDEPVHCTTSVGLAQMMEQDSSIDDLLRRADRALYRAKMKGRNRTEVDE